MDNMNLWGELELKKLRDPKKILQEQSSLISEMSKNIILGEIKTRIDKDYDFLGKYQGECIMHSFSVICPQLNNYKFLILEIKHSLINFYPVSIYYDDDNIELFNPKFVSKDEEEFVYHIKGILSREEIVNMIKSLYSQSI